MRLVVNVAAATAGTSETIRARSGPGFVSPLIPHRTAAARNPLGAVTPPLISVKAKAISVNSLQYLREGLGSKTIMCCFFIPGADPMTETAAKRRKKLSTDSEGARSQNPGVRRGRGVLLGRGSRTAVLSSTFQVLG